MLHHDADDQSAPDSVSYLAKFGHPVPYDRKVYERYVCFHHDHTAHLFGLCHYCQCLLRRVDLPILVINRVLPHLLRDVPW